MASFLTLVIVICGAARCQYALDLDLWRRCPTQPLISCDLVNIRAQNSTPQAPFRTKKRFNKLTNAHKSSTYRTLERHRVGLVTNNARPFFALHHNPVAIVLLCHYIFPTTTKRKWSKIKEQTQQKKKTNTKTQSNIRRSLNVTASNIVAILTVFCRNLLDSQSDFQPTCKYIIINEGRKFSKILRFWKSNQSSRDGNTRVACALLLRDYCSRFVKISLVELLYTHRNVHNVRLICLYGQYGRIFSKSDANQ